MKIVAKRIITAVMAFLLCFSGMPLLSAPAFAEGNNRTVKVGYFSFPGYHEFENGQRSGYGYDFLQRLRMYTDLNYEYIGYDKSWEDMQEMLLNGEIDFVTSAGKNNEREKLFDFSEPIGKYSVNVNVRSDDWRFNPGNYDELEGMVVGELKGSSRNDALADFAMLKGFTYSVREFDTAEELASALRERKVDAVVTSSLRKSSDEKTVAEFDTENFYAIVRKGDTELLDEINYGITQMNVNLGDWQSELYYKNYVAESVQLLSFTQREKEYIKEVQRGSRTITVTARPDRNPYSFVENGELTGIIPDYFAHLMEMAGLPYTVLMAKDRDEFDEWMFTNHTDVVMDCQYASSPSEQMDFGIVTSPYMEITTSRVTQKGFKGAIRSVAAVNLQDSVYLDKDIAENAEYIIVESGEEAMQAVKDGRADACYVYTYMAEKFINTDPESNLQSMVLSYPVNEEYIYVSPESAHELCSILDKCIRADVSRSFDGYVKKYTSATFESLTPTQYLRLHPQLRLMGFLLTLAVIIFIAVTVNRGRTERLKNAQLAERLKTAEELSNNRTVIDKLSEDFQSVDYVKLTGSKIDDIGIQYKNSDITKRLLPEWEKEKTFTKNLDMVAENIVYEPDREQFINDTRRETIVEKLNDSDVYYVNYRAFIDNEIEYHQVVFYAVRENGELVGMVAGFRSVDETVKKEVEIQKKLESALDKAETANKAKTEFLFNMSHDIRTPMNAILGFTNMAKKHIDDREKVDDCLTKTQQSGTLLLSLINSILDMSRIESGSAQLQKDAGDVLLSFSNIEAAMQEIAATKDIELTFKFGEVKDRYIYTDFNATTRVFTNLISNSIKYSNEGGWVKVFCEQCSEQKDGVALYRYIVEDNGAGMSREFQKHMFEAFTREHSSTLSGVQGTGLGLSVCKTFVDYLGGTIECDSELGRGTKFTVTLPFEIQKGKTYTDPETGSVITGNVREENEEPIDFTGMKVLLVEDNELNSEIAAEILEEEGLIVEDAPDGKVSVEMMEEKGPDYYDFILMDIQMPVMNGYEATRAIREMYPDKHIPIIAVSANAFDEDKKASKDAGMDDHVAKPIKVEELFKALAKCLQKKETEWK